MTGVQTCALPISLRRFQQREEIFDVCRKRWVALTPEEWVRQQVLLQLTNVLQVPESWIAVEKEIEVNQLRKRFDILVYDDQGKACCLIECKASDVPLSAAVFDQLMRYQLQVQVPYLIITNGGTTRGWFRVNNTLQELSDWPPFGK